MEYKDLLQYCKERGSQYYILDDRTERLCRKKSSTVEELENQYYNDFVNRGVKPVYIAEVNNAIAIGGVDGLIVGDQFVSDYIDWFKNSLSLKKLPIDISDWGGNNKKILYRKPNKEDILDAICLLKMWSGNIYHFTFEVIARLGFVDNIEEYKDYPILLDKSISYDSRNIEIIDRLNVNKRQIIWVDEGKTVRVKHLVNPPKLLWYAGNYDNPLIDERLAKYMRTAVLDSYVPKKIYDKVYISRGNNKRLLNESEIETYFRNKGFEIFCPENGSFWDEVDCFSTANCIVGCVGAAFTNVIYSKMDALIIQICSFHHQIDTVLHISDSVGIRSHLIVANDQIEGRTINTSSIYFPIERCEKIMKIVNEKLKHR